MVSLTIADAGVEAYPCHGVGTILPSLVLAVSLQPVEVGVAVHRERATGGGRRPDLPHRDIAGEGCLGRHLYLDMDINMYQFTK